MNDDVRDLIDDWDSIYQGYYLGDEEEIDAVVTRCADRLEEARATHGAGSPEVAFPALGLVLMYGHVMWHSAPGVADRAAAALRAVAADGAGAPCDHAGHPSDQGLGIGPLEAFPTALELFGDPGSEDVSWDELHQWPGPDGDELPLSELEAHWRCPRTLAGFASAAAEAIRPASPADI
ncbi:hypothetical protein ACFZCY_44845 [Streptomyces sp. NPDC007983]|uniref:hypothetical protein n=1 Tax=Streptomyces sp. NPDC007983 TaxID=3364800 RepID=UPI0036E49D1B